MKLRIPADQLGANAIPVAANYRVRSATT